MTTEKKTGKIISIEERRLFWYEHDKVTRRRCRKVWGGVVYGWYRVTRLFGLKGDRPYLQLLHGAALTFTVVFVPLSTYWLAIPYVKVILGLIGATPATAPATTSPAGPDAASSQPLLTIIQGFCAAIITWYKYATSGSGGMSHHELARRETTTYLINQAMENGGWPSSPKTDTEARLRDIAVAIQLDAEESLGLQAQEISVVVLAYSGGNADTGEGSMSVVTRTRPKATGGLAAADRLALESYAFEAIRRKKAIVYHDTKARLFRETFEPVDFKFRTVLCIPILPAPNSTAPCGVITLGLKHPYMLVRVGDCWDSRLSPYAALAAVFWPTDEKAA